MKKLENKILKKVYLYEVKKTAFEIAARVIGVIIFGLIALVFGLSLFEIFSEQSSFDFLQILNEDFEVIKKFFIDSLYVFYLETPKLLMFLFVTGVFLLFLIIIHTVKQLEKIKNRIKSILKYFGVIN